MREFTVAEVCKELARLERRGKPYHKTAIYKLIKNQKLKTINAIEPLLISEADLLEYVKNKEKQLKNDQRTTRHFSGY